MNGLGSSVAHQARSSTEIVLRTSWKTRRFLGSDEPDSGAEVVQLGAPAAVGDRRSPDLRVAVDEIGVTHPDDIVAGGVDEEAERRADARIDVEQLVAPVSRVEPQAEIDDAAVTDCAEEPDDLRLDLVVHRELAERREAPLSGYWRIL